MKEEIATAVILSAIGAGVIFACGFLAGRLSAETGSGNRAEPIRVILEHYQP